jgi:hypothetical protein
MLLGCGVKGGMGYGAIVRDYKADVIVVKSLAREGTLGPVAGL